MSLGINLLLVLEILIPFIVIGITLFSVLFYFWWTSGKSFNFLKKWTSKKQILEIQTTDLDYIVNEYNYLSLQESPELLPDFYFVNEIRTRMEEKCGNTQGEYLRRSPVKFSGSQEDWEKKNKIRGIEFEKQMHEEALEYLQNHYLIKYSYQFQISQNSIADMLIRWEGINKRYCIIVECKHSGDNSTGSYDIEQLKKGYLQLFRYKEKLSKKIKNKTKPVSYLLVLLIDFPNPFKSISFPFSFKGNVFILNYKYFSAFLETINEITIFI